MLDGLSQRKEFVDWRQGVLRPNGESIGKIVAQKIVYIISITNPAISHHAIDSLQRPSRQVNYSAASAVDSKV